MVNRLPMTIEQAIQIIGLRPDMYLQSSRNLEEGNRNLEKYKEDVKKMYRQRAMRLHPDTGDTPDPEMFSKLTEAKNLIMQLKYFERKPQPVIVEMHEEPVSFWFRTDATSSGTASSWHRGGEWHWTF